MARKEVNVKALECTCERCGHEWRSFQENPTICPKCKSAYWDRPKRENS